jgi:hypothetical protein
VRENNSDHGLIVCDKTDERLNRLLRRMRRYNPVPNDRSSFGDGYRDLQLKFIVEDPVHRDSRHTYFLQAVDTIAFFLYQADTPNAFIKKKGARLQYTRLKGVACTHFTRENDYGVKRL